MTAQRFVPASLLPFGGFGEPDLEHPVWRSPANFDPDKIAVARAQHSFAQAVQRRAKVEGMSIRDIETLLGYRPSGLSRKLNGLEALTMRDVTRAASLFGASVIAALAAGVETLNIGLDHRRHSRSSG